MNRKLLFDTLRDMFGRAFLQEEVDRIDRAIDRAMGQERQPHRLGALSEQFESSGRGPGTVSSGKGDPGGVSYGSYQLATRTGTVAEFVAREGARWASRLGDHAPGSPEFSAAWKAIAEEEPEAFAHAQHDFIHRTHYGPVIRAVRERTGLDCDGRHQAVRDAVWSVAVQHGRAVRIVSAAVEAADALAQRDTSEYDHTLIEAIYAQRSAYVLKVAARSAAPARRTLESLTRHRYPAELQAALTMLEKDSALA